MMNFGRVFVVDFLFFAAKFGWKIEEMKLIKLCLLTKMG